MDFYINIVEQFGYIAVFILMTAENIFPPIPSEIILLLCGFLSSITEMNFFLALISATAGSMVGAIVFYYVGTKVSKKLIRKSFATGTLNKVGFRERDLTRVINLFNRHGVKLVFWGRFIPIVRSLISIPAGIIGMGKYKFFLYSFFGCLFKNAISIYAGYMTGSNWEKINHYLNIYKEVFLGITVLAGCILIYYFRKKRANEENKSS